MTNIGLNLTQKVVYTVTKDFQDFLFFETNSLEIATRIANKTCHDLMNIDIKFRKPTVTVKKEGTTTKTSKGGIKAPIQWVPIPSDEEYGYSTEFCLQDGHYPLYSFDKSAVIGAINDTGRRPLSNLDKRTLIARGITYIHEADC
jgi:hypothetical protein